MKRLSVIVAAGSGSRMGSDMPKQFLEVNGKPLLFYTIEAFLQSTSDLIVVVLSTDMMEVWKPRISEEFVSQINRITFCEGGSSRFQSVRNGLKSLGNQTGVVAIHDAARACITSDKVDTSFQMAEQQDSAVLAVDMKDSIRQIVDDGNQSVDRTSFKIIQTPQTFNFDQLIEAYSVDEQDMFTDDASVFEFWGGKINLVEGDYRNIKVTTPEDLIVVSAFLK